MPLNKETNPNEKILIAQLVRAVEYTDCTSAEE